MGVSAQVPFRNETLHTGKLPLCSSGPNLAGVAQPEGGSSIAPYATACASCRGYPYVKPIQGAVQVHVDPSASSSTREVSLSRIYHDTDTDMQSHIHAVTSIINVMRAIQLNQRLP